MQPEVTIGVPVYNGAPFLEEALDSLRRQTLKAIEVVISDNASSDETPQICERFCRDDPRFRYVRQPTNIGMIANFEFVLREAKAPFFAWRSYDDTSDETYYETLARILRGCPTAVLAATDAHWDDRPENYQKWFRVSDTTGLSTAGRVRKELFECAGAWFYGLYRTEPLIPHWEYIRDVVKFSTYHGDIIALVKLMTAGEIVTAPGSTLYIRRVQPKSDPYPDLSAADMAHTLKLAWSVGSRNLAGLSVDPLSKAVLTALFVRYLDRRVVRVRRLWKTYRASRRATPAASGSA
jgi:glycosyltransferase involved in cell wall biosynthesis